MTMWLVLIGTAITALASLAGMIWTANSSIRASREAARAAPYETLAKRVDVLEQQVATLRHERSVDRDHIRSVHSTPREPALPQPPRWYHEERGSIGPAAP